MSAGPIPPPPPIPFRTENTIVRKKTNYVTKPSSSEDIKHAFSERLKKLVSNENDNEVLVSIRREVESVLQEGPSCGLVCVAMASQVFGPLLTVDEILYAAINRGFTKQGEMFSVANMKTLIEDVLKISVSLIDTITSAECLIYSLLLGDMCLVPYDSDFNNEPCNKKGHKAHWALLTGCGLVLDRAAYSAYGSGSSDAERIISLRPDTTGTHVLVEHSNMVVVYGHQGKSQYPGVWTFSDLISSNRNLVEVDPNRQEDEGEYVIPVEGIHNSLRGKALVLSNR